MRKSDHLTLVSDREPCAEREGQTTRLDEALMRYHTRTTDPDQPFGHVKTNLKQIYNNCVDGNVIEITGLVRPPEAKKQYIPSSSIRGH